MQPHLHPHPRRRHAPHPPGRRRPHSRHARRSRPLLDRMPRDMYLEDIPLEEALERFWSALDKSGGAKPLAEEEVSVEDALHRVTAAPVFARTSVPHYHAAAMDGIAVRADETLGATESAPLQLRVGQQAIWVDTGDPMPPDTNAVIMAEHVQEIGDDC